MITVKEIPGQKTYALLSIQVFQVLAGVLGRDKVRSIKDEELPPNRMDVTPEMLAFYRVQAMANHHQAMINYQDFRDKYDRDPVLSLGEVPVIEPYVLCEIDTFALSSKVLADLPKEF